MGLHSSGEKHTFASVIEVVRESNRQRMIVIYDKETARLDGQMLAATIGFFDGVHQGHRFLIEELKRTAQEAGLPSAVITFPRHPRAVLHADYQPQLLHTFEEKIEQLATTGIDYCIVLDFTPELSQLSAHEFIRSVLVKQLHVQLLLIGYDHRFGHDRAEGFEQYVKYGKEQGMEVRKASAYDEGRTAVSSSEVRRLLADGRVEDAARLLTCPYRLKGHVVKGYGIGRTLGFPTANVQVDDACKVVPRVGVYAVWTWVGGVRRAGMLYIGSRPTLENGTNISMEVNIFGFTGDIYQKEITVSFMHFVREDIRFDSLDALKEQLARDRQAVEKILEIK